MCSTVLRVSIQGKKAEELSLHEWWQDSSHKIPSLFQNLTFLGIAISKTILGMWTVLTEM